MAISRPNYTQIPNEILDDWMAKLSGAQFKVICKIWRNTFGWQKEKDGISVTQLAAATGIARRHIMRATQDLEEMDLIESKKTKGHTTIYRIKIASNSNDKKELPKTEVVTKLQS
jgi:phage replication O-like protein O